MFMLRNATTNIAALARMLLSAGCNFNPFGPEIGSALAFCYGTVTGRVTDAQTGQVIAGAQVSGPGKYSSVTATTDGNGQYRLSNVRGGRVDTVYADAADYTRQARVVSVPVPELPQTAAADFALSLGQH
jgi:hypothetical protein